MLSIPPPIISTYILPGVIDKDLNNFSFVCKEWRKLCIAEAAKRALEYRKWGSAVALFNHEISVFLKDEKSTEAIERFLQNFQDQPFKYLSYFSSILSPLSRKVMSSIQNGLDLLKRQRTKDLFYSQLDCPDESIKTHLISVIKICEMQSIDPDHQFFGPHPLISIDGNRDHLSLGNLACFFIAQQQLAVDRERHWFNLLDNCSSHPMDYYNRSGHKRIIIHSSLLKEASSTLQQTPPPLFLEQLKTQVGVNVHLPPSSGGEKKIRATKIFLAYDN